MTRTREEDRSGLQSNVPDGARILIVCDDDSESKRLKTVLLEAGFVSECAKSITEGCEAAKSGRFQVVVSTPLLRDGSWRRLTDIANHYDLGFEVVLWAPNFDFPECAEALDEGAFDVLDAMCEQPRTVETAKCALWAAYLKGAGPEPRAILPRRQHDSSPVVSRRESMGNLAKIDQKGRLKIPMALLSTLQELGTEFYVTSENGDSVRIYPMQVWNQVEERLEHLCSRNRNNQKLLTRAKYFGQAVTVDKQGRVLIPIVLRNSAQMHGAVDVLDYPGYLEVWNHARFLKSLRNSPVTPQDEKTLQRLSTTPLFSWAAHGKEKHVRGGIHHRRRRHSRGQAIHTIRGAPQRRSWRQHR